MNGNNHNPSARISVCRHLPGRQILRRELDARFQRLRCIDIEFWVGNRFESSFNLPIQFCGAVQRGMPDAALDQPRFRNFIRAHQVQDSLGTLFVLRCRNRLLHLDTL